MSVGNVFVVRDDMKKLTVEHLRAVYCYCQQKVSPALHCWAEIEVPMTGEGGSLDDWGSSSRRFFKNSSNISVWTKRDIL